MLLEAKKLDKTFNGVYALKGLDFSIEEGESPRPGRRKWRRKVYFYQNLRQRVYKKQREINLEWGSFSC